MKIKRKLALLIFGISLPLLILELVLRTYSIEVIRSYIRTALGDKLTQCQVRDSILNHKLLPNCNALVKTKDFEYSFNTNSLGLRNKEIGDKKEGVFRVLIVGDSYAEGWGLPDDKRFDSFTKEYLASQSANFEVIDAGIRSYSPVLELNYLKNYGIKLKPDLVIMFFDFSDLHDDYYYGGWPLHEALKQELMPEKTDEYLEVWPSVTKRPVISFLKNSKLFATVYDEITSLKDNGKQKFTGTNLSTDISLFGKAENWPDFLKAWNLNLANIFLMNDYLNKNNIKFSIAVVPRGIYINDREWNDGREILGLKKGVTYDPQPIFNIEGQSNARGIPVVDLYNPLKEESENTLLYYPFDGHWNGYGSNVVGKTIAEFLIKNFKPQDLVKN